MGTALGGYTGAQVRSNTAATANSAKTASRSGTISTTGFPTRNNQTTTSPLSDSIRNLANTIGSTSSGQANAISAGAAGAAMAQSSAEAAALRDWQAEMWQQTSAYNAAEAQKNRDWQERMSNTAYQRAMADMKAAGLNPILAYQQGGASTPGGSVATMGTMSGAMGTGYSYQGLQENSDSIKIMSLMANTAADVIANIGAKIEEAGSLWKFLKSIR